MPDPRISLHVPAVPADERERRAAVRYPCTRATSCQPVPEGDDSCPARVLDVSATGIGLLMDHPFEPETFLAVDLHTEQGERTCTLMVQVRHVREQGDGQWLIGCAFARPLRSAQVKAML